MHIMNPQRLQPQPSAPDLSALPPALIERLAGEGVFTLGDWRALGRRRRHIFGVTAAMCREIDRLARGAA